MPRREDIERFAQVLNSLGDEPAIRAARAESIEEVPPPAEQGQATEGDQLDALPLDAGGSAEDLGGAGHGRAGKPAGIFAGLEGLPGEEAAPAEGSAELPLVRGALRASLCAPGDEIDFSSLFGEETAAPPIEEIEKPAAAEARPCATDRLPRKVPLPPTRRHSHSPAASPRVSRRIFRRWKCSRRSLGEETPAARSRKNRLKTSALFPGRDRPRSLNLLREVRRAHP